jgi:hypothetical protein
MWLTKKLEQFADKLEARQKARKKERRILAEAMRDRDLSPTEREKLTKAVTREYFQAIATLTSAFRVMFLIFVGSAAAFALLYYHFHRTWAFLVVSVPLLISFTLLALWLSNLSEMREAYTRVGKHLGIQPTRMWKHLGIQLDDPPTSKETPSVLRPNTENPPPIDEKIGPKQIIARTLLLIPLVIAELAVILFVRNNPALIALLVLITILQVYVLEWVGEKKRGEPIPLVSWLCEFKPEGHTIELAFQIPPECNTLQTQERIRVATRAILRNFNAETLQDTLETGLFKDVSELKIPVFRIQILAIDKVVVPEPVKEKQKEPTVYI